MNHFFRPLLQILFFIYVLLALSFWLLADNVLFQPPKHPNSLYLAIDIPLANQQTLSAVYLPNPKARYTILFSHGNAEDLFFVYPFLQLLEQHGFAVFAYDYPGYGKTPGKPTEANTYQAINAAYDYLTSQLNVPPSSIIIYGRSVGAGPSIELARNKRIGGLILESPFVSAFRVYTKWPMFPFDRYRNLSKIPEVRAPILLIHGTHDSVIPLWHGQKIYDAIKSPKQAYWVENASHNDVQAVAKEQYFQTIQHFAQSLHKD
jgi:fermentation-respiration switch protein FrsA (DUF1100 family)